MSKKDEANIYTQISEARKRNYVFDRFVELCEGGIACWIDKIKAENDVPCLVPKTARQPAYTKISIFLPVVSISPNETNLLMEYLEEKYLKYGTKTVGGDFFRLKKCLFKQKYKLSSHCCDI